MNLRTPHTQAQYDDYQRTVTLDTPCYMCLKEEVTYDRWNLVKNRFPYDVIAKPGTHVMFCPKRHVAEEYNLNDEEIEERNRIIRFDLSKAFSCIVLNFAHARTNKSHLHYQLWVNRD